MNLLAIDTSTDYLSIAIMRDGKVCARHHRKAARMHSTLLVPAIGQLLKRARMTLNDIDAFCVSVGPGSFTGLRIGVTTIKAFAYAFRKKIAAVPTLDVIAENAKSFCGIVCPVLDARKGKVYTCLYTSDGQKIKRVSPYMVIPAEDLARKIRAKKSSVVFLGDGVKLLAAYCHCEPEFSRGRSNLKRDCFTSFAMTDKEWHPRADVVAKIGLECLRKKESVTAVELEPLYLYSKECAILGK